MHREILFRKKVDALAILLFFIGMFILIFLKWLPIWAAAMASAFIAVSLRQFMVGKIIDIFVSLILFGLLFFFNSYCLSDLWTGILLIVGSGYMFIRQCFEIYTHNLRHSHSESGKISSHDRDDDDEDPED